MNLGALIGESARKIRKNWILILPPLLNQVVIPLAVLTMAELLVFPLMAAFALTGDFWGMIGTAIGGLLVFGVAGFVVSTFVTAGWAYMNKRVVIDGETNFQDLWIGARKYFVRILGGRILVGALMTVPILVAVAVFLAITVSLVAGLTNPGELSPEMLLSLLGPFILGLSGMLLLVGLVELVIYIFTLTWMEALVTDDTKIIQSMKLSYLFARRNSLTVIGYIGVSALAWIGSSLLLSPISSSFSSLQLAEPTVYADGQRLLGMLLGPGAMFSSVVAALLSVFFTLLLFLAYVDRTRSLQPVASAEAPRTVRSTPRGTKCCVNCGETIFTLAVFCPHCGARQPPLPPQ